MAGSLLIASVREVVNVGTLMLIHLAGELARVIFFLVIIISVIPYLIPTFLTFIHQLYCSIIKMVFLVQMVTDGLFIIQIFALGTGRVLELAAQTGLVLRVEVNLFFGEEGLLI